MAKRSGLGRGLNALIPGASDGEAAPLDIREGPFRELPIEKVSANTFQPRKYIDEQALAPLADSIKELGVLQPILVREKRGGSYELIAGERRWRASKLAGLTTIPALVRRAENVHSLEQALVENLHRKDLNAIDEASAYRQLIDDFSMTHEQVAKRVGKGRTTITNSLRLLQLPTRVQKHLMEESLSEGHARALLGTEDEAFQSQLADRVKKEGLSVRAVEEAIRLRNELDKPQTKKRKLPSSSSGNAASLEWQERLVDRLDTKVSISTSAKRGRIVIEFADLEDLDRLGTAILNGKSADEDLV